MDVRGLGYIGIDVADVDAWRGYAELLGTRVITHEDGLALKIDDRPFRVMARLADSPEGLAFAGWELARERDTYSTASSSPSAAPSAQLANANARVPGGPA